MTDEITQNSLKRCASCADYKPLHLFAKSSQSKDGLHSYCKPCANRKRQEWREQNRDKDRASTRRWADKNLERARSNAKAYWASHREEHKERCKSRYYADPEKHNAETRAWYRENRERVLIQKQEYAQRNKDECAARSRFYKSLRRYQMPSWANRKAIADIYRKARKMSRETGMPYHVDHIVPVTSKLVCGLHVEFNLQILPGTENIVKGNRRWPDMPLSRMTGATIRRWDDGT